MLFEGGWLRDIPSIEPIHHIKPVDLVLIVFSVLSEEALGMLWATEAKVVVCKSKIQEASLVQYAKGDSFRLLKGFFATCGSPSGIWNSCLRFVWRFFWFCFFPFQIEPVLACTGVNAACFPATGNNILSV